MSYERAFGDTDRSAGVQVRARPEPDATRAAREERRCVPVRYNWGLAESKRRYELNGKRPRLGDLKQQLVELKNTDAPWLYEVSAHIGQSALKDLNVAFERFFKSVSGDGPKVGYPRFKKKGDRDSARIYEVTLESATCACRTSDVCG